MKSVKSNMKGEEVAVEYPRSTFKIKVNPLTIQVNEFS